MSSLVIYANEFDGHLNNGLAPEAFKYRLLVEGDSWMDRSAMFHTSLLQKLAPRMDAAGDEVLIVNLSRFGDTMRRMGDCAHGEFRLWIGSGSTTPSPGSSMPCCSAPAATISSTPRAIPMPDKAS